MRVLDPVEQRLLQLRRIDPAVQLGRFQFQRERDLLLQPGQELRPVRGLQLRLRQLGEARVAADEAFQVPRAFLDGAEDFFQPLHLLPGHQLGAGMRQRGDRRQRVVQFVADDADHLLPGMHFLAAQFGGEQADQQQFVRAAVETEAAPRQMVDLLLLRVLVVGDGEQAVAAARHGLAQRRRHAQQQLVQALAVQFPAAVQQLACGQVGEHHAAQAIAAVGGQQHRHRRVLLDGGEHQFALRQALGLFAQDVAQLPVRGDHFAQCVVTAPVHAEVVLAIAVAADGTGQGAEQRAHRRGGAVARRSVHHISASRNSAEKLATSQPRASSHGIAAASASTGSRRRNRPMVKERCSFIRAEFRSGPCAGTAPAGSSPTRPRPGR